jgi:hypothetical protein
VPSPVVVALIAPALMGFLPSSRPQLSADYTFAVPGIAFGHMAPLARVAGEVMDEGPLAGDLARDQLWHDQRRSLTAANRFC